MLSQIGQCLRAQPRAAALHAAERSYSYLELDEAAGRLAGALAAAGVSAGQPVAVLLPRGVDMVCTLLALLRLGAPYVPLDPTAPAERLLLILRETGASHLVGDADFARASVTGEAQPLFEGPWTWIRPEERDAAATEPPPPAMRGDDDLFCILYTSGSTGQPKGVELTQRNVSNCLQWMQREFALTIRDRMLFKTPLTFDVSMYELFWPLMAGASVVLAEDHRDAGGLAALVRARDVTAAHFVPSMLAAFLEEPELQQCRSLRQVFAAGEALSPALARRCTERLPGGRLHNLYGPTEAGVVSHWTCRPEDQASVPIGHAVDNTRLYVLDEQLEPTPAGEEGELCIAGAQLARGYINRPEVTALRFLLHPRLGRIYRTGDRVRLRDDGALEYLGRRDQQVKLRGVRIELGEIESRLNAHPDVVESAAGLGRIGGEDALVAWYQPRGESDGAALRDWLAAALPQAMLPQALVALPQLPHLPNGKIDRRQLPDPASERPALATSYAAPSTPLQQALEQLWLPLLGLDRVGVDDRFFELGGSSLMALQLMSQLRSRLGRRLPLSSFFAAPTIAGLAAMLERDCAAEVAAWLGKAPAAPSPPAAAPSPIPAFVAAPRAGAEEPIAIVGMACRVPGAGDVDAFWLLLAEGREGIRDLGEDELAAAGVPAEALQDPAYVRRAGTLQRPYAFDAAFFGYSPREAELMDPQQRLLLECAWHALEHAGIPAGQGRHIGVYAGVARNQYFDRCLASYEELRGDESFSTLLGADKDYAATRVAYRLDLRGPALTLQTACSSSGVALHLACQGLRQGDCEAAIVGGVRVNVPDQAGYRHVDGGPQARDGRVRPFDAAASGMLLSSGVACLVLKPLSRALAEGERVYAVIRGSAINNDGADKAGYTAPSEEGQFAAIRGALEAAGVDPQTVGYIEAHGTGTALGDPIEVAALNRAYESAERIALGSVKGNIGHLDAGAGAVSVLKAALALQHGQLPPTPHFEQPNPECGFEQTPFFVNTALQDWSADGPRRAGVSSFGFGGTNFHAVLEEAPPQATTASPRAYQLLRLSARTPDALQEQARRLSGFLAARPQADLADLAYTLDTGRARLPQRLALAVADMPEALQRLAAGDLAAAEPLDPRPSLVLMFPGQGAQHPQMGRELYEREPLFRRQIDRCAEVLEPELGLDLRRLLYPSPRDAEHAEQLLRETACAQPAIFAVSYATAKLWESWGLRADAMVGHSLGEFVAATLGGVFQLEDALRIIAARGRLMQGMPPGGMLAARLSEEEAQAWLGDGVVLGGINSPNLVVLSGPADVLARREAELRHRDIACSPLHTSHAFHSPMMDPVVQPFAEIVAQYERGSLDRPLLSTLSGSWATAEDLREPFHWARQLREPVRFATVVAELLKTPGRVFLEVGPGQNLCSAVRQALRPEHRARALASLPHAGQAELPALRHMTETAGHLWMAGIELDAARFYQGERRCKLGLPSYPFNGPDWFIAPAAATSGAVLPQPRGEPRPGQLQAPDPAANDPVLSTVLQLMTQLTGHGYSLQQQDLNFLELGFESLALTQLANKLKAAFKVELRFRRLLDDLGTMRKLCEYLRASGSLPAAAPVAASASAMAPASAAPTAAPQAFGAGARIRREQGGVLDARQQQALAALQERYLALTPRSRAFAQQNRAVLADPRTVSGFRPLLKELVYPIVVDRSEGAHLWDLDGNRYVDATCGFGSMFFGHKPAFLQEALTQQLAQGWEIGPQTPLAGECAQLFTAAVDLPRVAFCNTGSEAVLAAVRLARTVSGRNLIVSFKGDYHGIQDEVIVRAGSDGRSLPAAPGIPGESVANTLLLDYGTPEALEIIRRRADEIAGVLIEPVQSRRPELQPREFLQQLRQLTSEAGIAFIMDEVITGFRSGLQGAQAFYGVKADIGVYGKVFGGGMPVGAVAGIPLYLDALDGGHWQYGDDSVPEAGVTYFAGTFVRHPLTLAAVRASLLQLRERPELPAQVAERTRQMVERINDLMRQSGVPLHLARYSSLWKPAWDEEQEHGDLLFYFLREHGIHIWEGRPCFLSAAHDDADCEQIVSAFRYAVTQMAQGGFLERRPLPRIARAAQPPLPQARIGRDAAGNPAWFVPDPERAGKYLQLERAA